MSDRPDPSRRLLVGGLDILVNNAVYQEAAKSIDEISDEDFDQTFQTNVYAMPIGRPDQPAELAGIYVLLASNEASYSTGQVFGTVGGRGGP